MLLTTTTKTKVTPIRPAKRTKEYSRNSALALAQQGCTICFGLGRRCGRNGTDEICHCVWRAIFNACMERFRRVSERDARVGRVSYEPIRSNSVKPISTYSMLNEEFLADFVLIAFRELNGGLNRAQLAEANQEPSRHWKLFNYHMLLGADWRACCGKLGLNRGNFFHDVYRIQSALGRAFAETEPFSLFPLDEYFSPGGRVHAAAA